jgi:hypothetical protein
MSANVLICSLWMKWWRKVLELLVLLLIHLMLIHFLFFVG